MQTSEGNDALAWVDRDAEDETHTGGKLGRKSGAIDRAYDRLTQYVKENPL